MKHNARNDLFTGAAEPEKPKRRRKAPATPQHQPAPEPQQWPDPANPPAPWPDPAKLPVPYNGRRQPCRALAIIPAPEPEPAIEVYAPKLLPAPGAPCPVATAIAELPATWPPVTRSPFPQHDLAATVRSLAAKKAMANRDRYAAGRKAAETRAARKAALAGPPAFADYVSERIGTRRWVVGPVARRERTLHERVITPAWYAALRDAYRVAYSR